MEPLNSSAASDQTRHMLGSSHPSAPVRKYPVFLSYSRADAAIARWLHRALERYVVPRAIRRKYLGISKRPFFPVFIDEGELAVSTSLTAKISEALNDSERLVVVCSPSAATARWVNEEIRQFRKMGKWDQIFPIIADGAPNASAERDPGETECFPAALRSEMRPDGSISNVRTEPPLAADLRPWSPPSEFFQTAAYWLKSARRHRLALLKLVAGMLDVHFDDLVARHSSRRKVQWAVVALLAVGLASLGAILLDVSSRARDEARRHLHEKIRGALVHRERDAILSSDYTTAALVNAALWDLNRSAGREVSDGDLLHRLGFYNDRIARIHSYYSLSANERLVLPGLDGSALMLQADEKIALTSLEDLSVTYGIALETTERPASWIAWEPVSGRAAFVDQRDRMRILNLKTGSSGAPLGLSADLSRVAISRIPDRFCFKDRDDRLHIHWENGRIQVINLPGGTMIPHITSFAPDGKLLAVTSISDEVKLALCRIDAATSVQCEAVEDWGGEKPLALLSCKFSTDGSKLACRSFHGEVKVFATKDLKPFVRTPTTNANYQGYEFSNDSKRLYLTRQNNVEVWELTQPIRASSAITRDNLIRFTIPSPSGRQLAVATDQSLVVYDTTSWAPAFPVIGLHSPIAKVVFLDGDRLALVFEREIQILRTPKPNTFAKALPHPIGKASEASRCRRGRAAPQEADFITKNLEAAEINVEHFVRDDEPILARAMTRLSRRAVSPDGCLLGLAAPIGNLMKVVDLPTGEIRSRELDASGFDHILFAHNSARVAVTTSWGELYVLDAKHLEKEILHDACGAPIRGIAFSPDGKEIIAADAKGNVRVWDISNTPGHLTEHITQESELRALEISADGMWLSALDADARHLRVWQLGQLAVTPAVFSAPKNRGMPAMIADTYIDGSRRWLWMTDTVGAISVWGLDSGELVLPIMGVDGTKALAIGPAANKSSIMLATQRGRYELVVRSLLTSEAPTLKDELELLVGASWNPEEAMFVEVDRARKVRLATKLGVWRGE